MLVEQCLNGDRSAYKTLYDRYSRAMYATALRITGQGADAEDVLQDAFCDAFSRLNSMEKKGSFGSWLKQIVIFKSIAMLKSRRIIFEEISEVDASEVEPVDEAEVTLTVEAIRSALFNLPTGYRTVLSLYLLEGYDQDEIAEILHLAPGTVRSQYKRGKEKLLQLMKSGKIHEQA